MDSDDSSSTEREIRHGSSSKADDSRTCENVQTEEDGTKPSLTAEDKGSPIAMSQHVDASNPPLQQEDVSSVTRDINAQKEASTASQMMIPSNVTNLSTSEAARMKRIVDAQFEMQRLLVMRWW